MNATAIIFGTAALGFFLLIILAIRRMMAAPAKASKDDKEESSKQPPKKQNRRNDQRKDEETDGIEMSENGAFLTTEPAPVAEKAPEDTKPKKSPKKERDYVEEKSRLQKGLAKTRGGIIARLGSLFKGKPKLDAETIDQIEEILFTADIGVKTSQEIMDFLKKDLNKQDLSSSEALWKQIKQYSNQIFHQIGTTSLDISQARPFVILIVGVNGSGKTTTIGKLSARFKDEGYKVLLAAGDTFRAAAVEQLEIWGQRSEVPVVKSKEGSDPSSVIVEALKQAKTDGTDIVIADTAGRLHTKIDLMDELKKVKRSISKWSDNGPHETWLVLDANTGQNAIAQARMFKEAMDLTGIILTKLDGTAKGGVILGITNELKLPVRYIGIGEKIDDLREFDPQAFVDALYDAIE